MWFAIHAGVWFQWRVNSLLRSQQKQILPRSHAACPLFCQFLIFFLQLSSFSVQPARRHTSSCWSRRPAAPAVPANPLNLRSWGGRWGKAALYTINSHSHTYVLLFRTSMTHQSALKITITDTFAYTLKSARLFWSNCLTCSCLFGSWGPWPCARSPPLWWRPCPAGAMTSSARPRASSPPPGPSTCRPTTARLWFSR